MKKLWMLTLVGTFLYGTPVRADDKTAKTESEAPKPAGQEKQVSKFATKYKVSEETIRSMRTSGKGMGWGEIGHALAISEKSGQPLADILKLRESGMGWGQIAEKYNFKLGDVTGKAKAITKEGEKAEKADAKSAKGAEKSAAGKTTGSEKGAAGRANGAEHKNSGGGHGGNPHK